MERRQAEHFLALCESGTFTAASVAVGVTQPALSQSIRSLEDELGVQLIERGAAGITPTPAGHRLAPIAADILRSFAAVHHAVRPGPAGLTGTLRITCPVTLVLEPLLPMLEALRRAEPAVRVEVEDSRTEAELLESVAAGRTDCAITPDPPDSPGLIVTGCGQQHIVAVLPPGARPVDRRLTTLLSHGLVSAPRGRTIRRLLDAAVGSAAVARSVVVETDQAAIFGTLVLQGVGVAFLPEGEAQRLSDRGLRVIRPDPPLVRDVALVQREANSSAELRAFRAAISTAARTKGDDGTD